MNLSNPSFKVNSDGSKWAYLYSSDHAGRNVLVREDEYPTYVQLAEHANNNFHALYIFNQIRNLNCTPNPINSLLSKLRSSKRKLVLKAESYIMRSVVAIFI